MRCIFCKLDSTGSKSVEHIIPESLGNTMATLPPGVVCDKCNNYFAGKVEKPFLEAQALSLMRFHHGVVSKRGRIPPAPGVLSSAFPVILQKYPSGAIAGSVTVTPDAFKYVMDNQKATITYPTEAPLPEGPTMSRFLGKVAVEVLAQRLMASAGGLDYVADEKQFDPIREHARYGKITGWPFHVRRIYDGQRRWSDESCSNRQVVYEYDILITSAGEWYLVIALFGLEHAINIGGPDIAGYLQWLSEHDQVSPLYFGKNAGPVEVRPAE